MDINSQAAMWVFPARRSPCRITWRCLLNRQVRTDFVVSREEDAAGRVRRWLGQFFAAEHPVPFVLNVAGPRESKARGIQKRTRKFLAEVLGGMLFDFTSSAS